MGEHMIGTFKAVAVAMAAAFTFNRIKDAIFEVGELTDQLGKSAERVGWDIGELDAWGQAVDRAGGSASGFVGTLDYLNKGMADIAVKGTSRLKPFFDELKINVLDAHKKVRPLQDLLGDLADRLSKMSKQESSGFAEKLGIDSGTLLLLASGRVAMDDAIKRQKELGVITQQNAERAEKFNDQWDDTKQIFRNIAAAIGDYIFPAFTKFLQMVERVTNYLSAHKGLIEGFFIGLAGVIGVVFLPSIISATLATLAFLAPWLLIGAAIAAVIAAFALFYDDVQNFLAGNQSVIGELSKTWPAVGETVRAAVAGMQAALKWFVDYAESGFAFLSSLVKFFVAIFSEGFKAVGNFLSDLSAGFAKAFPDWTRDIKALGSLLLWLVEIIAKCIGWFAKLGFAAVAGLPDALKNWSKRLDDTTAAVTGKAPPRTEEQRRAELQKRLDDKFGHEPAPGVANRDGRPGAAPANAPEARRASPMIPPVPLGVIHATVKAQAAIKAADTTPLAAQSPAALAASRGPSNKEIKVSFSGPITVNTQATDAEGMAKGFAEHVGGQLRQAISHADDGVEA
jgi:hypothetical protein